MYLPCPHLQDQPDLQMQPMIAKGAYIIKDAVNPDVILLANGSEVSTQMAGAQKLEEKGLKVRVVSAPSEGLFRQQSAEYQQKVLPAGIPVFGLTAGLPVNPKGTCRFKRTRYSDLIILAIPLLIKCWMKNSVLLRIMW